MFTQNFLIFLKGKNILTVCLTFMNIIPRKTNSFVYMFYLFVFNSCVLRRSVDIAYKCYKNISVIRTHTF